MEKYDPARSTWFNEDIEYMFDNEIIEYDITDAGYSLIKQFHLLPDDEIDWLEKVPKGLPRHVAIGKLQRENKQLSTALSDKFAEVRKVFIEFNNVDSSRIISVKKDAIFTIGKCDRLKFGQVEFVPKNVYSSYIRFPVHNMELYYSSEDIEIKGMNDNAVNKHRIYMIEFLKDYIRMMESHDQRVRRMLIDFIDDFKNGELEDQYYLEFNSTSANPNALYNYQNILIPLVQIVLKEIR